MFLSNNNYKRRWFKFEVEYTKVFKYLYVMFFTCVTFVDFIRILEEALPCRCLEDQSYERVNNFRNSGRSCGDIKKRIYILQQGIFFTCYIKAVLFCPGTASDSNFVAAFA